MSDLFSQPFEDDDDERAPAPRTSGASSPSRELTGAIRGLLETGFGDVWVEGEISNCRVWNTGHMYFTLKDGGAQIRAVMFRSAVRYLKFKAEDGLHVIARGRLGVYEPKGEYQLVCEHLEPHGLGALQLAFEQLKKKLQAEGLFDAARKRPLPALPGKIGIVTSLDGAALRDIIKVLARRHPNAHLVIRPTRVQGDGAAAEIAEALRAIGRVPGVDVIIVGRGGGSAEDSGRSTRSRWRARLRLARCRSSPPSATRSTSRSPTSSPTCAPRRRRRRRRSSSRRRTTSAPASIGRHGGCGRRCAASIERRAGAAARPGQPPRPRWLCRRVWRCAAGTPPS